MAGVSLASAALHKLHEKGEGATSSLPMAPVLFHARAEGMDAEGGKQVYVLPIRLRPPRGVLEVGEPKVALKGGCLDRINSATGLLRLLESSLPWLLNDTLVPPPLLGVAACGTRRSSSCSSMRKSTLPIGTSGLLDAVTIAWPSSS
jgi:hypothetical protein